MARKNNMKYCKVIVDRPVVIHEDDIVDLHILKKELEITNTISTTHGLYVYKKGYDYPQSSYVTTIHIWCRFDKTLHYINQCLFSGMERGRVRFTGKSFYFEKV